MNSSYILEFDTNSSDNLKNALFASNAKSQSNGIPVVTSVSDSYSINTFIYLTVGFIYVVLLSLIIDKILQSEKIDELCLSKGDDLDKPLTELKYKKCREMQKQNEKKKFTYMVSIGIASILIGGYVVQNNPTYSIGGLGVGLGGAMTVIYYTIKHWSDFDTNYQILILLIAFIGLIYGSAKLLQ
jgi:hypothetical protein